MTYRCWDESGTEVDIDADDSESAAQEYVAGGDWPDDRTTFHQIWTLLDPDGDTTSPESHLIVVDPVEPDCSENEHDWRETYLRGHGGGVLVAERCTHCALDRCTDTWATCPVTGSQGHTVITYETAREREDR